jgi:hypothetical protein
MFLGVPEESCGALVQMLWPAWEQLTPASAGLLATVDLNEARWGQSREVALLGVLQFNFYKDKKAGKRRPFTHLDLIRRVLALLGCPNAADAVKWLADKDHFSSWEVVNQRSSRMRNVGLAIVHGALLLADKLIKCQEEEEAGINDSLIFAVIFQAGRLWKTLAKEDHVSEDQANPLSGVFSVVGQGRLHYKGRLIPWLCGQVEQLCGRSLAADGDDCFRFEERSLVSVLALQASRWRSLDERFLHADECRGLTLAHLTDPRGRALVERPLHFVDTVCMALGDSAGARSDLPVAASATVLSLLAHLLTLDQEDDKAAKKSGPGAGAAPGGGRRARALLRSRLAGEVEPIPLVGYYRVRKVMDRFSQLRGRWRMKNLQLFVATVLLEWTLLDLQQVSEALARDRQAQQLVVKPEAKTSSDDDEQEDNGDDVAEDAEAEDGSVNTLAVPVTDSEGMLEPWERHKLKRQLETLGMGKVKLIKTLAAALSEADWSLGEVAAKLVEWFATAIDIQLHRERNPLEGARGPASAGGVSGDEIVPGAGGGAGSDVEPHAADGEPPAAGITEIPGQGGVTGGQDGEPELRWDGMEDDLVFLYAELGRARNKHADYLATRGGQAVEGVELQEQVVKVLKGARESMRRSAELAAERGGGAGDDGDDGGPLDNATSLYTVRRLALLNATKKLLTAVVDQSDYDNVSEELRRDVREDFDQTIEALEGKSLEEACTAVRARLPGEHVDLGLHSVGGTALVLLGVLDDVEAKEQLGRLHKALQDLDQLPSQTHGGHDGIAPLHAIRHQLASRIPLDDDGEKEHLEYLTGYLQASDLPERSWYTARIEDTLRSWVEVRRRTQELGMQKKWLYSATSQSMNEGHEIRDEELEQLTHALLATIYDFLEGSCIHYHTAVAPPELRLKALLKDSYCLQARTEEEFDLRTDKSLPPDSKLGLLVKAITAEIEEGRWNAVFDFAQNPGKPLGAANKGAGQKSGGGTEEEQKRQMLRATFRKQFRGSQAFAAPASPHCLAVLNTVINNAKHASPFKCLAYLSSGYQVHRGIIVGSRGRLSYRFQVRGLNGVIEPYLLKDVPLPEALKAELSCSVVNWLAGYPDGLMGDALLPDTPKAAIVARRLKDEWEVIERVRKNLPEAERSWRNVLEAIRRGAEYDKLKDAIFIFLLRLDPDPWMQELIPEDDLRRSTIVGTFLWLLDDAKPPLRLKDFLPADLGLSCKRLALVTAGNARPEFPRGPQSTQGSAHPGFAKLVCAYAAGGDVSEARTELRAAWSAKFSTATWHKNLQEMAPDGIDDTKWMVLMSDFIFKRVDELASHLGSKGREPARFLRFDVDDFTEDWLDFMVNFASSNVAQRLNVPYEHRLPQHSEPWPEQQPEQLEPSPLLVLSGRWKLFAADSAGGDGSDQELKEPDDAELLAEWARGVLVQGSYDDGKWFNDVTLRDLLASLQERSLREPLVWRRKADDWGHLVKRTADWGRHVHSVAGKRFRARLELTFDLGARLLRTLGARLVGGGSDQALLGPEHVARDDARFMQHLRFVLHAHETTSHAVRVQVEAQLDQLREVRNALVCTRDKLGEAIRSHDFRTAEPFKTPCGQSLDLPEGGDAPIEEIIAGHIAGHLGNLRSYIRERLLQRHPFLAEESLQVESGGAEDRPSLLNIQQLQNDFTNLWSGIDFVRSKDSDAIWHLANIHVDKHLVNQPLPEGYEPTYVEVQKWRRRKHVSIFMGVLGASGDGRQGWVDDLPKDLDLKAHTEFRRRDLMESHPAVVQRKGLESRNGNSGPLPPALNLREMAAQEAYHHVDLFGSVWQAGGAGRWPNAFADVKKKDALVHHLAEAYIKAYLRGQNLSGLSLASHATFQTELVRPLLEEKFFNEALEQLTKLKEFAEFTKLHLLNNQLKHMGIWARLDASLERARRLPWNSGHIRNLLSGRQGEARDFTTSRIRALPPADGVTRRTLLFDYGMVPLMEFLELRHLACSADYLFTPTPASETKIEPPQEERLESKAGDPGGEGAVEVKRERLEALDKEHLRSCVSVLLPTGVSPPAGECLEEILLLLLEAYVGSLRLQLAIAGADEVRPRVQGLVQALWPGEAAAEAEEEIVAALLRVRRAIAFRLAPIYVGRFAAGRRLPASKVTVARHRLEQLLRACRNLEVEANQSTLEAEEAKDGELDYEETGAKVFSTGGSGTLGLGIRKDDLQAYECPPPSPAESDTETRKNTILRIMTTWFCWGRIVVVLERLETEGDDDGGAMFGGWLGAFGPTGVDGQEGESGSEDFTSVVAELETILASDG